MQLTERRILVCGGTQQMGISLVQKLIAKGAEITIAHRGKHKIKEFENINTVILDRTNQNSVKAGLQGKVYDAVIDFCAYNDKQVSYLLDSVKTERYIQISSNASYRRLTENQLEEEFNPKEFNHEEARLATGEFTYQMGKRLAEYEAVKYFSDATIIRCPYIYGKHDLSGRLKWFVQKAINNEIFVFRADRFCNKFAVSHETEAGNLICFLLEKDVKGIFNAASDGYCTVSAIIHYLQNRLERDIMVQFSSENHCHYNNVPSSYLNLDKAKNLGYEFSSVERLFKTIDWYLRAERLI